MSEYTVAIIGTGPDPSNPTVDGFAMGYRHAEAYRNHDRCRVVACADVVPENGDAFADAFDVPAENVFEEYERMLEAVGPDIVSIAVPPAIHEAIVVGCAKHDAVRAINCEKPMAHTWASAQRMVQACWRYDTQLTFNRQRRFAKPFTEANRLLEEGEIGDLSRIEIGWGDFYDTGAHSVDLAGMFAGDRPAEWVIAQLDYREEDVRFGAHQENQMWAQWAYDNGVHAVSSTGRRTELIDSAFVLRGTEGTVRIDVDGGPMLELECGGQREAIDVDGENIHNAGSEPANRLGSFFHDRLVEHLVDSLDSGDEPVLSGRIGLNTAEILFAGYESVRRRGRVDLPLEIDDNPFEEMIESGALSPEPTDD
ncbi:Gfo/Idh/MocA family oxidoreductase [Natrialba sp. INN-245]|uniref:Gfo/Idh/MocA family protein n=1 Tax=Natrialba sp. INN-245 TaxID=2690967 RepID=UPI00190F5777|nr:Gfo/Idh/MocA family oxidoreductase [Natrialba sp. INN-245]